ncbi:hypothetical protein D3C73_1329300 [compost metagenome]
MTFNNGLSLDFENIDAIESLNVNNEYVELVTKGGIISRYDNELKTLEVKASDTTMKLDINGKMSIEGNSINLVNQ